MPIERRAVLLRADLPGTGPISRLIVNDEGPHPTHFDRRQLEIKDYLLLMHGRAFTWQESSVERSGTDNKWTLPGNTGPFLEDHGDTMRILNGNEYSVYLPVANGHPTTEMETLERRQKLDEFTEILGTLSIGTYKPGIAIPDYL